MDKIRNDIQQNQKHDISINMFANTFTINDMHEIVKLIHSDSCISEIYLLCYMINHLIIELMRNIIPKNILVKLKIICINNYDNANDIVNFFESLITSNTLTHLKINTKIHDNESLLPICKYIHNNKILTHLTLGDNNINDENAVTIVKYLHTNNTLIKLSIKNNMIGDRGAIAIAKSLHNNNTLKKISLNSNTIRKSGAMAIAKNLGSNHTLTLLCMNNNKISNNGIYKIIEESPISVKIDLENNKLNRFDVVTIAKNIIPIIGLTYLNLSNNVINDKEICELLHCIQTTSTMKYLYLNDVCTLNHDIIHEFTRTIKYNESLELLYFNNWAINMTYELRNKCICEMIIALQSNTNIHHLSMYYYMSITILDENTIHEIAELLDHNQTLKTLLMMNYCIGDNYPVNFINALQNNYDMTSFRIDIKNIDLANMINICTARNRENLNDMRFAKIKKII